MYEVLKTTILGLSLPHFSGTEAECFEWIAAQKLAGDRSDYVVKVAAPVRPDWIYAS